MSETRQLAAIMFTDIVGYTSLMQHDEQKALVSISRFKELLEKITPQHQGKIVQYFGDGCLVAFDSSTQSVECAVALQKAFSDSKIPVKMGLHLGDVIFRNENVFGDGVNIASRIESLGIPGAILVSKSIRDQIRNKTEFQLTSIGSIDFKNVEESIEVFAVSNPGFVVPKPEELRGKLKTDISKSKASPLKKWVLAVSGILLLLIAAYFYYKNQSISKSDVTPSENSIAVLYFNNMSGDPTKEYFSDGITEEIISRLSMIKELRVKSRTSVSQFKNTTKSTREIADELGINHILEGSVRIQGDKVRINTRLINAKTDEPDWDFTEDRELKDIFELQSDIAHRVAKKFRIEMSDILEKKLSSPPTLNSEAYDLFLRANSMISPLRGLGRKSPDRKGAIYLLHQAIKIDPGFSDAYALLSENYTYIGQSSRNPKQWLDSAAILAQKAIDLNPDREAGYKAMAYQKRWEGNHDEQLKWLLEADKINAFSSVFEIVENYSRKQDYRRAYQWVNLAIQFDPAEPSYYAAEGSLYLQLNMPDSLKNCLDRARRLKFESPEIQNLALGYYGHSGNEEEFIALCKRIFALDEKQYSEVMGVHYVFRRDWKKADSLLSVSNPDGIDAGLTKIQLGQQELGRRILSKVIEERLRFSRFDDMWHNHDMSRCYAAMRDNRYVEYLEKAIEKGWHYFAYFERDPFYDPVRESPGFKKIRQSLYDKNEKYKADLLAAIKEFNK